MPISHELPLLLLLTALLITAIAAGINRGMTRRKRHWLQELARESRMHYSARDVFGLARRVAPRLPVIGAADVRVCDLIYGSDPQSLRYVFSAEYTVGVVHSKSRQRCVVSVVECKQTSDAKWTSVQIAPSELPFPDQYRALLKPAELVKPQ
jgi:hypothetical protein